MSMSFPASGTTKEQVSEGITLNFCINSVWEFDADTETGQWIQKEYKSLFGFNIFYDIWKIMGQRHQVNKVKCSN